MVLVPVLVGVLALVVVVVARLVLAGGVEVLVGDVEVVLVVGVVLVLVAVTEEVGGDVRESVDEEWQARDEQSVDMVERWRDWDSRSCDRAHAWAVAQGRGEGTTQESECKGRKMRMAELTALPRGGRFVMGPSGCSIKMPPTSN